MQVPYRAQVYPPEAIRSKEVAYPDADEPDIVELLPEASFRGDGLTQVINSWLNFLITGLSIE